MLQFMGLQRVDSLEKTLMLGGIGGRRRRGRQSRGRPQTTPTPLYAGGELQGSPVWQALAGHKRSFPLAVVLPPPARLTCSTIQNSPLTHPKASQDKHGILLPLLLSLHLWQGHLGPERFLGASEP